MSGASARYSGLRIPVETSTPPRWRKVRSTPFPATACGSCRKLRSLPCAASQNRTRFAGLRFCWCGLRARGAALPCDLRVCLGQGLLRCLAGPFKTGPGLLGSGFVGVGCAQGALRCLARTCDLRVCLGQGALRCLAIYVFVWGKVCFAVLRCLAGWGGVVFSVRTSPARGSRRRRFRS